MNVDQMSGFIVGGLAVAIYVYSIIQTIFYVFRIIANWKIFKKAGEAGWKALIPIYNVYIQYKLTWKAMMFLPVVVLGLGGAAMMNSEQTGIMLMGIAMALVGLVFEIIGLSKLSKSFGHGGGFTLGLVFLNPIFVLILGFGSSRYIGNASEMA